MASRKEKKIGKVIEALPAGKFKVEIDSHFFLCYPSGKMVLNQIRILVGDMVDVDIPPNSDKGRITYRR